MKKTIEKKTKIENIINKLDLNFVKVKLKPSNIDEKFIYLMLEFCSNGFDDLIKNPQRLDYGVDVYEMKTSELVKLLVENPKKFLKPAWFLGLSGGEGVITSKAIEDEFTIYLKYEKREMAKIYG